MGKIVEETRHRESTLLYSLVALLCIVVFMACGYVFLSANFAILLFLGWLIAAAFAMGLGYKFTEIENLAYQSAQKGIGPAAIIMAVNAFTNAEVLPLLRGLPFKITIFLFISQKGRSRQWPLAGHCWQTHSGSIKLLRESRRTSAPALAAMPAALAASLQARPCYAR